MSESRIPLWESGFHAFLASRLLNAGQLPELRRVAEFIAKKTGDDWTAVTEAGRQAILHQTGFLLPNGL